MPEVLIAAGIMGGIGLALMFLTQQQTKQTIKSRNEADLAMAKSEIIGLLNNPNHCNSNFKGLAANGVSATITDLKTCQTTSCTSTTGTMKFRAHTSTWPGNAQNLQGQISERVKIASINRTVPIPTSTATTVSSASLVIKFVFKGLSGAESDQTVTFPVSLITASGTVQGCPKSTNSTVAY